MRTLKAIVYNRNVEIKEYVSTFTNDKIQASLILSILASTLHRDVPEDILAPDDDIIKVKTQAGHLIWQIIERMDAEQPMLRIEVAK